MNALLGHVVDRPFVYKPALTDAQVEEGCRRAAVVMEGLQECIDDLNAGVPEDNIRPKATSLVISAEKLTDDPGLRTISMEGILGSIWEALKRAVKAVFEWVMGLFGIGRGSSAVSNHVEMKVEKTKKNVEKAEEELKNQTTHPEKSKEELEPTYKFTTSAGNNARTSKMVAMSEKYTNYFCGSNLREVIDEFRSVTETLNVTLATFKNQFLNKTTPAIFKLLDGLHASVVDKSLETPMSVTLDFLSSEIVASNFSYTNAFLKWRNTSEAWQMVERDRSEGGDEHLPKGRILAGIYVRLENLEPEKTDHAVHGGSVATYLKLLKDSTRVRVTCRHGQTHAASGERGHSVFNRESAHKALVEMNEVIRAIEQSNYRSIVEDLDRKGKEFLKKLDAVETAVRGDNEGVPEDLREVLSVSRSVLHWYLNKVLFFGSFLKEVAASAEKYSEFLMSVIKLL